MQLKIRLDCQEHNKLAQSFCLAGSRNAIVPN